MVYADRLERLRLFRESGRLGINVEIDSKVSFRIICHVDRADIVTFLSLLSEFEKSFLGTVVKTETLRTHLALY